MPHGYEIGRKRDSNSLKGEQSGTVKTATRPSVQGVDGVGLFSHSKLAPAGVSEVGNIKFVGQSFADVYTSKFIATKFMIPPMRPEDEFLFKRFLMNRLLRSRPYHTASAGVKHYLF